MTFGKNSDSWLLGRLALFHIWLCLLGAAPLSLAHASPQSEPEVGATGWDVEQLLESLAKNRQAEARFEETAFSNLLTQPLKTQGTLHFIPPAGIEKHITAPYDERYVIEGDRVFFESKTKATKKTVSLHDYPALRAFIEAFRSTLANDLFTLRRFYRVELQGAPRNWILILHPLDTAVQELVEFIRLSGEQGQLHNIEILMPDGNRSVMVITTGAQ
jgi:hypothetical protein